MNFIQRNHRLLNWSIYVVMNFSGTTDTCQNVVLKCFIISLLLSCMMWRPMLEGSNLVDSASSHTLVSKIKPCMSKYKCCTLKLRMAHYISYNLFDSFYYLDNRSNSRANTCINTQPLEG